MFGQIIMSTYPNLESVEDAVRYIVKEKRLAACVNFVKINSRYIWNNKFVESEEYLVLFKATKEKIEFLKKEVEERHPYKVPEIVEITVNDMNRKYLDWLNDTTGNT